jgi:hypothetical protein
MQLAMLLLLLPTRSCITYKNFNILYAIRDLVGSNNNSIANCIVYRAKKSNQPEDGS